MMIITFTEHQLWKSALCIAQRHQLLGDIIICQSHLRIRGKLAAALQALGH